ncbi:Hypothetical Protein NG00_00270 [Corynebacterium camporealensis]|uniref:Uncharacterized protein n=1 Tax=Corynebacterium camporealensis TaxID=161896 RepID=A0A0F6QVC8_9CORY|nr:DUF3592 domain-containing protein [Corynebacterium camporealensis]AKE38295.1 hypothetical protein UL81_01550 [Corynebacterium camporealensis]AVH87599.1 Hypothetical Protein NG00_00270 [Corynebacterium camporealensis]MDY5839935.1 DUF3592 domain-containing protein [Corynebacterium camporealensis]
MRRITPAILRRRLYQLILVLYAAAMLGAVAMVLGPFLNDRAIDREPARALATVTDVSWSRTNVDFQDADGVYHSPQTGLLYPTGLGEGQQVWVIYAADDPDLVKVEGREWTLSVIPALSSAAVATLIAVGAWWLVGRVGRKQQGKPADKEKLTESSDRLHREVPRDGE